MYHNQFELVLNYEGSLNVIFFIFHSLHPRLRTSVILQPIVFLAPSSICHMRSAAFILWLLYFNAVDSISRLKCVFLLFIFMVQVVSVNLTKVIFQEQHRLPYRWVKIVFNEKLTPRLFLFVAHKFYSRTFIHKKQNKKKYWKECTTKKKGVIMMWLYAVHINSIFIRFILYYCFIFFLSLSLSFPFCFPFSSARLPTKRKKNFMNS